MAHSVLDTYRREWPRIGGLLGMAVVGGTALASDRLSKARSLSALNFAALLVHQFEEYVEPGWFPGQFNKGMFKSENPLNYPLNTNSALVVNTVFAYPFYIIPILLPRHKTLGLAPVLFGMSQALGHGIIFPRVAGDKYSPGFLASALLHVPIGIAYMRALSREVGLSRGDVARAGALAAGFAVVAIGGPNILGHDKTSPHAFSVRQMGHYAERPSPLSR